MFKNDIISNDKRVETRLALNIHSRKVQDEVELICDISQCNDVLYVSYSGENYYNCRCLQHHQSLILSNSEINDYKHEKCNRKYNLFVNAKDFEELAFIRKREIRNE